ncbi:MAG: hypothetical protein HY084_08355 [Gemmatimonadetes bacterium]|nr:hypothetical protein [Gemmatimonadota bacterium]
MQPIWHFNQFRRGDQRNDPISTALFSQDEVQDLAGSIVREAIQNSLDAQRLPVVNVRFSLRRSTAPSAEQLAPFLAGLWDHLAADGTGLDAAPSPRGSVPLLVIEDEGTTGLVGDPAQWDPLDGDKNGFFLFFHATGTSGKSGESRGRWGVGKFVFPMGSQANVWFGLTASESHPSPMLMGRCVLKTHRVSGTTFHPDGRWGFLDEDFVKPMTSPAPLVEKFKRACGINRNDTLGLSVVIPWIRPEVTVKAIHSAVVCEYFLPLLRGQLVVTIEEDGVSTRIDASSVLAAAVSLDRPQIAATVALAVEAAALPSSEIPVLIAADHQGNSPQWGAALVPAELRPTLASKLDAGEMVAVRIPIRVRPKDKPDQNSYVDIYVRGTETDGRTYPLIVREGITVPKARTTGIVNCVALALVDHKPLVSLVGDSENPAHTELLHKLIKEKYTYAKATLDFLREAPAGLVRALREGDTEADPFLMADLFPSPEAGSGRKQRTTPKSGDTTPPPPPPPPPRPRRFRIDATADGFRIIGQPGESELPATLRVSCAYEVRRGRPLSDYDPLDFNLAAAPIRIEAVSAKVVSAENNRLRFEPESADFRVTVGGFDTNRDVYVRVDEEN